MEIQQKDNETLATYIHHFKTAAKQCTFDNDSVAICISVKELQDAPTIAAKMYEKDTQTLAESHQTSWKTPCSTPTDSHTHTFHGQYDVQWW